MLFATGNIDDESQIINNTKWTDSYYQEESFWLQFLIAFQKDEESAAKLLPKLSPEYVQKANAILARNK